MSTGEQKDSMVRCNDNRKYGKRSHGLGERFCGGSSAPERRDVRPSGVMTRDISFSSWSTLPTLRLRSNCDLPGLGRKWFRPSILRIGFHTE